MYTISPTTPTLSRSSCGLVSRYYANLLCESRHCRPMLSELATELLTKILLGLHVGDLTRCKRVCSRWNALVTTDISLQYKMELDIAGMVDGPPGGVDLHIRLQKLRARNAAWETGLPLHTIMMQTPHMANVVWHCTGGFLLYEEGTAADNLQLKLHRPAYPDLDTSGGLEYSMKTLAAWKTCISSSSRIRSCAVNPEEDMVVVTKIATGTERPRCVVLSISQDNTPHPMAAQPQYESFDVLIPRPEAVLYDRIESVGDLVSWTIHHTLNTATGYDDESEMLVLNWKSGATVWRSHGKITAKCLLLDPSHVLVVGEEGLRVHEFNPLASPEMTPRCSTRDDASILLALPAVREGIYVQTLQIYVPGPRNFRDDRPLFEEDSDLSVLAIHMCTETLGRGPLHTEHLIFVVPISGILAQLKERTRTPPTEGRREIPWSQWGPDGARLLRVDTEPHIITIIGSRVAIPLGARNFEVAQDIFVVDVRPHDAEDTFGGRVRDCSAALGALPGRVDVWDTILGLNSFAAPVMTRLPYRMTYVKTWTEADAKLVVGQALAHDGIVITCNPLPLPIGQIMQQLNA